MKRSNVRRLARGVACTMFAVGVAVLAASAAYAADPDPTEKLNTILGRATHWLMTILAAVATFFLTVGAVRHVTAGGDPGEIEKAKAAYKSAATGYVLAALAPIVVAILKGILGIS